MKVIVNRYSIMSEKDYKEKGLNADTAYIGIVFEEDGIFFIEIGDSKIELPQKNGMLKKKYSFVFVNDKTINLIKSLL